MPVVRTLRWGLVALLIGTGLPATLGAGTASAAAPAREIRLTGNLQSELGCPEDWQPGCDNSKLADAGDGNYRGRFELPAGSYEFKVTVNGSWDENYGAGGASGGANIPLVLAGPATLDFRYSDSSHLVIITPTDLPSSTVTATDKALATPSLRSRLTKEQFYFVMTDRFFNGSTANDKGGLTGDRLATGLDPADKGFYHGGDLKGLVSKLDYIKGLGTTSIWLTPSFLNRPVQGAGENVSAGYHGYWITDFTRIDPHLGTNADMKALIDAAHGKGMKVFFDIITNHTADVIDYTEQQYTYVSKATSPYVDAAGEPFDDRDYIGRKFPTLNNDSFPYTPYFRTTADRTVKVPAWLNDPLMYHNRGDSTYSGESSTYGDFSGLDDLFTERTQVVTGMENIYKTWVDFGIDGFRIDTVKHVNTEFWQQFSPALLKRADLRKNYDFFMFGEVYDADPKAQSVYTTTGKLPATLDFGFQSAAVSATNGDRSSLLSDLFAGDDYYTDADSNAYNLPTFLGNHDMGRIGNFVGGDLTKDLFAHSLMYTLRGQPVIYYGDEQGFIGDGGDKDARQDMFASKVASYNDDQVIGGTPGSKARFGTTGPIYTAIAKLSKLRSANPALANGAQIPRYASDTAGIFAVSRVSAGQDLEYLVVANNSTATQQASFPTYTPLGDFSSIYGGGQKVRSAADGQVSVAVPAMTVRVYQANRKIKTTSRPLPVQFMSPAAGGVVAERAEIRAAVPGNVFTQAGFAYRPVGTTRWLPLGTDDNAPFRVFQDVSGMAKGTLLEYRVVTRDNSGHYAADSTFGVVGDPVPVPSNSGVGDVDQPDFVSVPGSLNSEMGCPADWSPDCAQAQMTLNPTDEIWKGSWTLPAAPYAYKAAIDKSWDENYGAGGVRNGGNIDLDADGTAVDFYYDHRTHYVSSTLQGPIVVAGGNFQSEIGCPADWSADCMRSWLQDPDGDGVYTLALADLPVGDYEMKVAVGLSWDESYGAGGAPDGGNLAFSVPAAGMVTTLQFDSASKVPGVVVAVAQVVPDLAQTEAIWASRDTLYYPTERLPAGSSPVWFGYRLHWGNLTLDDTGVGGRSVALVRAGTAPEGYLALKLDRTTAAGWRSIQAAPMVALAVYDDAGKLIDATGVEVE